MKNAHLTYELLLLPSDWAFYVPPLRLVWSPADFLFLSNHYRSILTPY